MKAGLASGYFEQLLEKYFLKNSHQTLLVMAPDTQLAARREAAQEKLLAEKKASMSAEEIEQVIAATHALKERQQSPETEEALKSIPILELADIRSRPTACRSRCAAAKGPRSFSVMSRRMASLI